MSKNASQSIKRLDTNLDQTVDYPVSKGVLENLIKPLVEEKKRKVVARKRTIYLNNDDLDNDKLYLDKDFARHARANQWSSRKERGYKHHTNIFEYIRDVYEPWLDGSMDRVDLKKVDPPAYQALKSKLDRQDMPEWLTLPRGCDKGLPPEGTTEHDILMEARAQNAARMKAVRALDL